jgi:L,D-transpeptidase catalytic domain
MKSPPILITLACSIALTACSSSQAQPNTQPSTSSVSNPSAIAATPSEETERPKAEISKSSIDSVSGYQCTSTNNHLFLGNGNAKNKYGNPIYSLHLCVGGREIRNYEIVTGRNFTQTKNRNQSGTHSPLPNGKYRMSNNLTQGMVAEVGRVDGLSVSQPFLPISPLFNTGRSALGFHVDPSYNRDPKEDGTSGCIGLTTTGDFKALWADIKRYQIRDLQVAINTRATDNPDVAEQP